MMDERASSPVIGDVTMIGVAVVAGALLMTLAIGTVHDVDTPAPVISDTDARLLAGTADNNSGSDGAVLRVTHISGEPIAVEEMAVAVDATEACGKRGKVVGLPADPVGYLDPDNIGGDPIISTANRSDADYDPGALLEEEYSAGESFELHIVGCSIVPGDAITIRVIHEPSSAVAVRTTVVAGSR